MNKLLITLVCAIFLLSASAYAATADSWNGGTGNWSTAGKWSLDIVPNNNQPASGDTYAVTITSGTENDQVTLDMNVTINSLAIGSASASYTSSLSDGSNTYTLTINGPLTINTSGSLNLNISTLNAASGSNAHSLTLDGGDVSISGNFTNSGAISLHQSNFQVGGTLTNSGTIDLITGQGELSAGSLSNSGTLNLSEGTANVTGAFTQSGGTTNVANYLSALSIAINGGTLSGTGGVSSANTTVGLGGTLTPGGTGSGGTLDVTGNLDLEGTFDEQITGTAANHFGVADITGNLTLGADSTLQLSFFNGFIPTGDDTFTIMDVAGAITGDFSNSQFTFDGDDWYVLICDGPGNTVCTSDDPSVILTDVNPNPTGPTAAPEPMSLALIGLGLPAIGLIARRTRALKTRRA